MIIEYGGTKIPNPSFPANTFALKIPDLPIAFNLEILRNYYRSKLHLQSISKDEKEYIAETRISFY